MPQLLATLPALNAKALVLDLLRMVHPIPLPVSLLVGAGRVLGINDNAIRVNITRLLTKAQIEQDERGYYRLGKQSEPFDAWLRQWQLGESRVKQWDGSWLLLSMSSKLKSKSEQGLTRLARHLGFREYISGTLIRPNNLQKNNRLLCEQIAELSHVNDFFIVETRELPQSTLVLPDASKLWDCAFLEKQYLEIIQELEKGIAEYPELENEQAFRNSYFVGAEVHHRLALDPLLPKEFLDTELRQRVIELFEAYDSVYRPAWKQFFLGYELKTGKSRLQDFRKVS